MFENKIRGCSRPRKRSGFFTIDYPIRGIQHSIHPVRSMGLNWSIMNVHGGVENWDKYAVSSIGISEKTWQETTALFTVSKGCDWTDVEKSVLLIAWLNWPACLVQYVLWKLLWTHNQAQGWPTAVYGLLYTVYRSTLIIVSPQIGNRFISLWARAFWY